MRNFFRSLTRRGVDALLISGQATVLYGAAPFTEDVDLWVRPDAGTCARLQLGLIHSSTESKFTYACGLDPEV